MKASRYNRIFQASDGTWLAFNAWSTALAEIEPNQREFIQALLASPETVPCDSDEKRAIREALIDAHFLITDEDDEVKTLKAERMRDRFRTDELYLTIAPTLDCNFRCDYCYEEHLKVHMPRAVQDALLKFVEARINTISGLHVIWYGGEPLLPQAYPAVDWLSEAFSKLAAERGLQYEAQIVTNGFLLDRKKMERMKSLGIGKVQITLDGPPEMHDKRRILAGGHGTFWRILENLKQIVDLAEVQVRINVDKRNAMSALDVVQLLQDHGLGDKVRVYLAQVTFDGAACGNILELCYSSDEFAKTEVELYREAARRGLPLSRYPFKLAGAFCTADRVNGYVVAPSGALFKCWHEVTFKPKASIGSLFDEQQPFQRMVEDRWLSWDAFEKGGCRSCHALPLCGGGCPLEAMKHPELDRGACETYKFNLEPLLEVRHLHRISGSGEGPARARQPSC